MITPSMFIAKDELQKGIQRIFEFQYGYATKRDALRLSLTIAINYEFNFYHLFYLSNKVR